MMNTADMLEILKLPDGGFLVSDASRHDHGMQARLRFACTDIDEALAYIRGALASEAVPA